VSLPHLDGLPKRSLHPHLQLSTCRFRHRSPPAPNLVPQATGVQEKLDRNADPSRRQSLGCEGKTQSQFFDVAKAPLPGHS
jgi:hypothetical protein